MRQQGLVRGVLFMVGALGMTMLSVGGVSAEPVRTTDGARAAASCTGVSVGPATTVVSDATRDSLGLDFWPDSAFGVWRAGDGQLRFIGPGFGGGYPPQRNIVTRGTLDDPVAGGVLSRSPVVNAPAGYLWVGGGPVYQDAQTGLILQVLHLEQSLPSDRFYATLHLGLFDAASGQTRYLGPLVRPELPFETAQALGWTADVGTSSLTVVGEHLHVYFPDYRLDSTGTRVVASNLSVARARLADVLAAARAGHVVPWYKYHDGGWESPAWGGPSSDLRAGRNPWGPHVVRHNSGAMVMVAGVSPREMVLSVSEDGVNGWSAEVPLFREPQRWAMYPTLVGFGEDPSIIGDQFYLYYTQFESTDPNWSEATVKRRLVTCTAGRPPGRVALIRYAGDGRHRVTTTPVTTPGFAPERGGVWYLLDAQAPGTRAVYGCRAGEHGYFLSLDPGCEAEGNAILQTEGWIHAEPAGDASQPLYRCYFPRTGDYLISVHSHCESPEATQQGLLGYAGNTSKVVFSRFYDGREHWETTGPVSAPYVQQRRWFLERTARPGTVALYGCAYPTPRGLNHFSSVHSDCERTTQLRLEGWIHSSPPVGAPSTPLYRCYRPAEYDHYLSETTNCDGIAGSILEGLMGYAETT